MKYKMICNVPTLHENGIPFHEGDFIKTEKGKLILPELTEKEAEIMNKWGVAGVTLVPATEKEIADTFKDDSDAKEVKEAKPKTYAQMNKAERAEYAKSKEVKEIKEEPKSE